MSNKDSLYKVGAMVRVNKINLLSYNEIGIIISVPEKYPNSVVVRFENWCGKGERNLYIRKNNLNIIKEGEIDMKITGNYRIAMVKFVDGGNTYTSYSFALFDDNINIDDLVLCDTTKGYNVAKVVNIVNQEEYSGVTVTKEIICKVDFSDFNRRKEARKRKETIKNQMDRFVKQNQELVLYQMLAEKNPEMKAMLEEYKELSNEI